MIRTVMKVLFSLGVGFVAALLVQVLGGALLFGGFFKRPQFWTQLQITGMSVVAALAGFVGATVATLSARRLQVRRAEWLVLPFLIFPGIHVWGYYTVKDSFAAVAFAATIGMSALLSALWLAVQAARAPVDSPVRAA